MIDEDQLSHFSKTNVYKKYIILFSGFLVISSFTFFLVRFVELAMVSMILFFTSILLAIHLSMIDQWESIIGIRVYFRKKTPVRMTILERIAYTQNSFREIDVRPAEAIGIRIISVFSEEQQGLFGKVKFRSNGSYTFFNYEIELLYSPEANGVRIFETAHADGITSISYVLQMLYPNLEDLQFRSIFKEKLNAPSEATQMEPMAFEEMEEINESKPSRLIDKSIIFYLENYP